MTHFPFDPQDDVTAVFVEAGPLSMLMHYLSTKLFISPSRPS